MGAFSSPIGGIRFTGGGWFKMGGSFTRGSESIVGDGCVSTHILEVITSCGDILVVGVFGT